ncbi:MAG: CRISPR-associated RAMP protein, Csm4 family [Candidatus Jettenia ecosi]|uniref:CRISPR system Cms protein Csm4 n=1 Tax=Candidatus Jettenia ecosi TaxID=2494326 RepID=A0A533QAP1_9BACT|nr:MAG: CRISPR-associated RAMP protein, Csm4 family [Candidatus Jettenia ecosi]
MKTYEIIIKPVTGFGTPLKGDTIFGHFCWQIAYDETLAGKTLDNLLLNYQTKPFAVFSSAYPGFCVGESSCYALKRPDLPLNMVFALSEDKKQNIEKRKERKAERWMILQKERKISSFKTLKYSDDKKLFEGDIKAYLSDKTGRDIKGAVSKTFITIFSQSHNKINRLTGTTSTEGFAPFTVDQRVFYPETELTIFVGIDDAFINIQQVKEGLERIGKWGFGKDASTGLGRFEVIRESEIDLTKMGSESPNACYTLAPCVPERATFSDMFFNPFTRFGRHGDIFAKSPNPFKNPVIMADEGGIFKPKDREVFKKPYIGSAVLNISKTEPKSVVQGYSLYIPVKVEV